LKEEFVIRGNTHNFIWKPVTFIMDEKLTIQEIYG